eukprot:2363400-Amphidinium_carterae.2
MTTSPLNTMRALWTQLPSPYLSSLWHSEPGSRLPHLSFKWRSSHTPDQDGCVGCVEVFPLGISRTPPHVRPTSFRAAPRLLTYLSTT